MSLVVTFLTANTDIITACNIFANKNKLGLRYNATIDQALMESVAAADSEGLEAVVYHGWTVSRHYVSDVRTDSHALIFENPSDRPIGFWSGRSSEGGQRCVQIMLMKIIANWIHANCVDANNLEAESQKFEYILSRNAWVCVCHMCT